MENYKMNIHHLGLDLGVATYYNSLPPDSMLYKIYVLCSFQMYAFNDSEFQFNFDEYNYE